MCQSEAHKHTTCGSEKCKKARRFGSSNHRYQKIPGYRYAKSGHAIFRCLHCKKRFLVLPHVFRNQKNPPRFCSRFCYWTYAHHKYGKQCTLSCVCEYMRDRIYLCHACGLLVVRYQSKANRRDGLYCSHAWADAAQQKRIPVQCTLCGKEVYRIKSKLTAKTDQYFCGDFCFHFFRGQEITKQTMYTPEFIRSLIGHTGSDCPFPNCGEERAAITSKVNPWGLCRTHADRVYDMLSERRRVRQTMLSAENL